MTSGDPEQFREVGSRFLTGLDSVEQVPVLALVNEQ
jgi:hypothetical protein